MTGRAVAWLKGHGPDPTVTTFSSNPISWVIIYPAAYAIGRFLLHVDALTGNQPISGTMQTTQADHLLQQLTGAGLETALGLFVMAGVIVALGYFASGLVWRSLVARDGVPL